MKHASISLDLDNQWAYMKTQGCTGWESFPTYLPQMMPRVLDLLRLHQQSITFFVVGKDATQPENQSALRAISQAGHEVANHSFMHEPWLHTYTDAELRSDFNRSEAALAEVCETRPVGFRGPGFSTSPAVRALLAERGYEYDASLFPTVLGPVARAYFLLNSKLPPEEKKRRSGLYGNLSGAYGSLNPYPLAEGPMEMPVTTMPLFRLPVHMSYLVFLAQVSESLARLYWNTALTLCRVRGVQPSMLLHPTDFLDVTDAPEMAFFPGIRIPAERKMKLVGHVLETLRRHYRTGTMQAHARAASTTAVTAPTFYQAQPNLNP
jgi:hypothetical protein